MYFQHYGSFEEAAAKWHERCRRISYGDLFFIWEFYDTLYDAELVKEFSRLSHDRHKALLHRRIDGVEGAFVFGCYDNDRPTAKILQYRSITGKRYLDEFDYVAWLNGGK